MAAMATRPPRLDRHRFVGDKRTRVVYDLDDPLLDPAVVQELLQSGQYVVFAPDTLPEARNRCYKLPKAQRHRSQA